MSKSSRAHTMKRLSMYSDEELVKMKNKLKSTSGKHIRTSLRSIREVILNRAKVKEMLIKD